MIKAQYFLPVISNGTRVHGFVPLAVPYEFVGDETELTIGEHTFQLTWVDVPKRRYRGDFRIACISVPASAFRGNSALPPGYHPNPDRYFYSVYQERDVIHWGPINLDPLYWALTYGTVVPPVGPPGPLPDPEDPPEVLMWTVEAPFVSSQECAFIDLDWTQFAPEGRVPSALFIHEGLPGWLKHMFVRADMNVNTLGMTQAAVSPTVRLFRAAQPIAGDYDINMEIGMLDGSMYQFILRLTVN